MAGEIEGPSEPDPGRHVQRRAAGVLEVFDAEDRLPECVGVKLPAVADAAEVGDGDGLWPGLHRHDAGARGLVGRCRTKEEDEEGEEEEQ